jgi:hypothetical protein
MFIIEELKVLNGYNVLSAAVKTMFKPFIN